MDCYAKGTIFTISTESAVRIFDEVFPAAKPLDEINGFDSNKVAADATAYKSH